MDIEYLERKAKLLNDVIKNLAITLQLLQLSPHAGRDVDATVKWSLIVQSLFSAMDPELAEMAIQVRCWSCSGLGLARVL